MGSGKRRPAADCYSILLHDEKYDQFRHFVRTRSEFDAFVALVNDCDGLVFQEGGVFPCHPSVRIETLDELCVIYDLGEGSGR